jgi:hypothetical protein
MKITTPAKLRNTHAELILESAVKDDLSHSTRSRLHEKT